VALSTRKREPRQAGNGATVARKGVAGPFPILSSRMAVDGPTAAGSARHHDLTRRPVRPSDVDSRRATEKFPLLKQTGDSGHKPRNLSPEGFARQGFSRVGLVSETFNAVFGVSSTGAPGSAPEAPRAFPPPGVVSTMWTESRNPNIAPLMARPRTLATNAHPSAYGHERCGKRGRAEDRHAVAPLGRESDSPRWPRTSSY
jgi:hypothetical protein